MLIFPDHHLRTLPHFNPVDCEDCGYDEEDGEPLGHPGIFFSDAARNRINAKRPMDEHGEGKIEGGVDDGCWKARLIKAACQYPSDLCTSLEEHLPTRLLDTAIIQRATRASYAVSRIP